MMLSHARMILNWKLLLLIPESLELSGSKNVKNMYIQHKNDLVSLTKGLDVRKYDF